MEMGEFRSKWVGDTERQQMRILMTIRALGPVIVVVDEADAIFGTREADGDSGVSGRVFAAFAARPDIGGAAGAALANGAETRDAAGRDVTVRGAPKARQKTIVDPAAPARTLMRPPGSLPPAGGPQPPLRRREDGR